MYRRKIAWDIRSEEYSCEIMINGNFYFQWHVLLIWKILLQICPKTVTLSNNVNKSQLLNGKDVMVRAHFMYCENSHIQIQKTYFHWINLFLFCENIVVLEKQLRLVCFIFLSRCFSKSNYIIPSNKIITTFADRWHIFHVWSYQNRFKLNICLTICERVNVIVHTFTKWYQGIFFQNF